MGIDMRSFPIHLDTDPVRELRADPELCELASGYPPFGFLRRGETLPAINSKLLPVVPAGASWVGHFDDRSFMQAEYLLDPAAYRHARTWEQHEKTTSYRIIRGAETFLYDNTGFRGPAWRCSSAEFLDTAVKHLDELDAPAVRREFTVAEMDELGLYKVHPEEDDEHAFNRILNYLHAFTERCRRVAAEGADLIITVE